MRQTMSKAAGTILYTQKRRSSRNIKAEERAPSGVLLYIFYIYIWNCSSVKFAARARTHGMNINRLKCSICCYSLLHLILWFWYYWMMMAVERFQMISNTLTALTQSVLHMYYIIACEVDSLIFQLQEMRGFQIVWVYFVFVTVAFGKGGN